MMVSVETYLRRGQRQLQQWADIPGVRELLRVLGCGGSGFLLSAASLNNAPQPIAMALCCALTGWRAAVASLGGILGYRFFWGEAAGLQGMVWAGLAGAISLVLGYLKTGAAMPLLPPAISAFLVSATGLTFQLLWLEDTSLSIYMLRIGLAAGSTWVFSRRLKTNDPPSHWICIGILVLSLAQITPVPFLSLGFVACGFFSSHRAFPAVVLAGLGMDLAQITHIPMTAVVCSACFLRLLPIKAHWLRYTAPAVSYMGVMLLWGRWDLMPLPGLLLGGALGAVLPPAAGSFSRQGQTGYVQVRLELTAGVLAQTQQLLLEATPPPIDEEALLEKVRLYACAECSARKSCQEREQLSVLHLRQPLDFTCRKSGRILGELRRGREQLFSLQRSREQQQECRWALVQQYQFLTEYLRSLSDRLPFRGSSAAPRYRVRVGARSRSKELCNGDRCIAFSAPPCRCYVALCDGMGTGLGAAREGEGAMALLKKMLTAGFPAEHAFRSINSILALRGQAGAVTLDLAEVSLDTGRVTLYKWGAAPSYLLSRRGTEKLGTATPPPGLSVTDGRETVLRLQLCRGETLILLSDGVEAEKVLARAALSDEQSPGELAEALLKTSPGGSTDDATVAVLRLQRLGISP